MADVADVEAVGVVRSYVVADGAFLGMGRSRFWVNLDTTTLTVWDGMGCCDVGCFECAWVWDDDNWKGNRSSSSSVLCGK